jgi:hypothetical protein
MQLRVKDEYHTKLGNVMCLADLALKNGYYVPHDTILRINELASAKNQKKEEKIKNMASLDLVLADLTSLMFPTTAQILLSQTKQKQSDRAPRTLKYSGLTVIVLAIVSAVFINTGILAYVFSSILALSLGFLGAVLYCITFVSIKTGVPSQIFDSFDTYSNFSYLVLGALLGWLVYFAYFINVFINMSANWQTLLGLSSTFFAGLIIKFVVGILWFAIYLLGEILCALLLKVTYGLFSAGKLFVDKLLCKEEARTKKVSKANPQHN